MSEVDVEKKRFHFRGVKYFFTVPHSVCTMERAMLNMSKKFDCIKQVWSEEDHADKLAQHLHGYVEFREPQGVVMTKKLKKLLSNHPHIEGVRSIKKTLEYIIKDGKWVCEGYTKEDVIDLAKPRSTVSNEVAMMLMTRKRKLDEVISMYPDFALRNLKKLKDFQEECYMIQERKVSMSLDMLLLSVNVRYIAHFGDVKNPIIECLSNLSRYKPRDPQLWMHGGPNIGKSHLIAKLETYFSVYKLPLGEDYYDFYTDECDLIVIDEYKGQKPIQILNQWLDGQRMSVKCKGFQRMRRVAKPMIVASNFTPDEIYCGVEDIQLDALKTRLCIVKVDEEMLDEAIIYIGTCVDVFNNNAKSDDDTEPEAESVEDSQLLV